MIQAQIRLQSWLHDLVRAALHREDGQDMVEYALLLGLITLGTIAIIVLVGPALKDLFQNIVNSLGMA